ncbi:STAS/SEC14 domain-containing protein [Prosthecobacter sp.]|uniref:STAS/SEC14 domain-containing protein n=1 Tax=Prosthecobacter sp. TaxID=1965333 RepID=UPI0037844C91
MAIHVTENDGGKEMEVRITGKLEHADYEHFVPEFERLLKLHGKLRVLFIMVNFHGWELPALWDDIRFDLKHLADIERLALVGDKRWEKWMATFCKPFTTARIQFFDADEEAAARQWLKLDS